MSDVQSLPHELNNHIMSLLQNDIQTLRACALTCRPWLASSRIYIFHSITLRSEDHFQSFKALVNSSPMIRECVRILRVDQTDTSYELHTPWVNEQLSTFFPFQVPNLKKLEFVSLYEIWSADAIRNLSMFTSVKHLSLVEFGMSLPELCTLISTFPNLQRCDLGQYRELRHRLRTITMNDCANPGSSNLRDIRVRYSKGSFPLGERSSDFMPFTIDSNEPESFLDNWLHRTPSIIHSLRSVNFTVRSEDVKTLNNFLRLVGPNLRELELECFGGNGWGYWGTDHTLETLNLTGLRRLQSFNIHFPSERMIRFILPQLTLLDSSPDLRRLGFRLRYGYVHGVVGQGLRRFASLFDGLRLKGRLEAVLFEFEDMVEDHLHEVKSILEEAYPRLMEMEVLRVAAVTD